MRVIARLLPLLLLATPVWAMDWHADAETCRAVTDAVLHGRVNAAADALTPDGADDPTRQRIRALTTRLVDAAEAAADHLPARLERILPDLTIDGRPAALELWSFGDRQAYLVGCGIRPMGDTARVSIQAYPTVDAIIAHLRAELDDVPLPGQDDQEPGP